MRWALLHAEILEWSAGHSCERALGELVLICRDAGMDWCSLWRQQRTLACMLVYVELLHVGSASHEPGTDMLHGMLIWR